MGRGEFVEDGSFVFLLSGGVVEYLFALLSGYQHGFVPDRYKVIQLLAYNYQIITCACTALATYT